MSPAAGLWFPAAMAEPSARCPLGSALLASQLAGALGAAPPEDELLLWGITSKGEAEAVETDWREGGVSSEQGGQGACGAASRSRRLGAGSEESRNRT